MYSIISIFYLIFESILDKYIWIKNLSIKNSLDVFLFAIFFINYVLLVLFGHVVRYIFV